MGNHFRRDAGASRRVGASGLALAVDTEQLGAGPRDPQDVGLTVRDNAVVAIGQPAAQRGHREFPAAQGGDVGSQRFHFFAHGAPFSGSLSFVVVSTGTSWSSTSGGGPGK